MKSTQVLDSDEVSVSDDPSWCKLQNERGTRGYRRRPIWVWRRPSSAGAIGPCSGAVDGSIKTDVSGMGFLK